MNLTDPIADMLARLRNAALARHERTEMPSSKVRVSIAHLLKEEGYIDDVRESEGPKKTLTIVLRYGRDRHSAIDGARRVSRAGRRIYVRHDQIPRVRNGYGIAVLSTSSGIMSDRKARKLGIGGELLCEVW
ncbi:MAG: 30S ribosomal protein S8 [Deltaproteobacteria bacterium]|nr:30S ribosomal protein S8 [Deltaproteobacteria bacterium]